MGYSKETERQNNALKDIIAGRKTEKRMMVGYKGKEKEKGDIVPKMTEIMQDVRMPLFCKKCDKVMKKKLDDKMWKLYNHCFDCQIEFEHALRVEGKYDKWEQNKVKQNKISYIRDQIQAITEWKDMKAPVFLNQVGVNYPELEKEKWSGDTPAIKKMAEEALVEYAEILNELEETK